MFSHPDYDGHEALLFTQDETLMGNDLVVGAKERQKQTVRLMPDAQVYGLEKRRLTDIKPWDFVASGACAAPMAKSTRSRSGYSQKPCAAPERGGALGT